jgi:pantoate--beta-alanine ligase
MFVAKTIDEVRKWRKKSKGSVGFIPTMGFLHTGHVSLIDLANSENDYVVVSIYVNPKQFGPKEDFNKYPRDEKHDLELLEKAKVTIVFLPDTNEIYPAGFETIVSVSNLSKTLEGEKRPGHFDGVATVVSKLFNIVQPTRAYFGQKDAQQVQIIKKMVKDLQFPIDIVVGKTVRQEDGLALSSRNTFLTDKQKNESAVISHSLALAMDMVKKGVRNTNTIKHAMRKIIEKTSGKIDYISIADPETLTEVNIIQDKTLVSLAVYYGKTRLIDNCLLTI